VRVALVPRSAEIKPLFWRFVPTTQILLPPPAAAGRRGGGNERRERGGSERASERARESESESERGKARAREHGPRERDEARLAGSPAAAPPPRAAQLGRVAPPCQGSPNWAATGRPRGPANGPASLGDGLPARKTGSPGAPPRRRRACRAIMRGAPSQAGNRAASNPRLV